MAKTVKEEILEEKKEEVKKIAFYFSKIPCTIEAETQEDAENIFREKYL